jgi:hypothetical protein
MIRLFPNPDEPKQKVERSATDETRIRERRLMMKYEEITEAINWSSV